MKKGPYPVPEIILPCLKDVRRKVNNHRTNNPHKKTILLYLNDMERNIKKNNALKTKSLALFTSLKNIKQQVSENVDKRRKYRSIVNMALGIGIFATLMVVNPLLILLVPFLAIGTGLLLRGRYHAEKHEYFKTSSALKMLASYHNITMDASENRVGKQSKSSGQRKKSKQGKIIRHKSVAVNENIPAKTITKRPQRRAMHQPTSNKGQRKFVDTAGKLVILKPPQKNNQRGNPLTVTLPAKIKGRSYQLSIAYAANGDVSFDVPEKAITNEENRLFFTRIVNDLQQKDEKISFNSGSIENIQGVMTDLAIFQGPSQATTHIAVGVHNHSRNSQAIEYTKKLRKPKPCGNDDNVVLTPERKAYLNRRDIVAGKNSDELLPQQESDDNTVTLTVFFTGTGMTLQGPSHLGGTPLFMDMFRNLKNRGDTVINANGIDLPINITESHNRFIMGFDGCAVTHGGFSGGIFGTGVEEHAKTAAKVVVSLIAQGKKVRFNAVGFSRGGCSAIIAAQELSHYHHSCLETNLLLADPVPGNTKLAQSADIGHTTLASACMDLSNSRNLKRVRAIYTHNIDNIFFSPAMPRYPSFCQVEEIVLPGNHGVAIDHDQIGGTGPQLMREFLRECDAGYSTSTTEDTHNNNGSQNNLLANKFKRCANGYYHNTTRETHSLDGRKIRGIASSTTPRYLNSYHDALASKKSASTSQGRQQDTTTSKDYRFFIDPPKKNYNKQQQPLSPRILKSFVEAIRDNESSDENHNSTHVAIILKSITKLNKLCLGTKACTQKALSKIFANTLSTLFTEERNNAPSFFTSPIAASNCFAVTLLNKERFRPLRDYILNDDRTLRYDDLKSFNASWQMMSNYPSSCVNG